MIEPEKVTIAVAENGIRTAALPDFDAGLSDGRASFNEGFPAENFLPKTSGGIPPWGEDMNAFLYSSSILDKYYSSGGIFEYDPAHQTAVGGYPLGAIIQKEGGGALHVSTSDNNMTDPTGLGANWTILTPDLYSKATGSNTAYVGLFTPEVNSIYDGMEVTVNTENIGTNSSSITPSFRADNTPARSIVITSGALYLNAIPRVMTLRYVASISKWILLNPLQEEVTIPTPPTPPTPTPPPIELPVGSIVMWSNHSIPTGWFECNGASFNSSTYSALYSAIAGIYGSYLPDMRGEFPRGFDAGSGYDPGRTLGSYQNGTGIRRNGVDWIDGNFFGFKAPLTATFDTDPPVISPGSGLRMVVNPNDPAIDSALAVYTIGSTRPRNLSFKFIIKWGDA